MDFLSSAVLKFQTGQISLITNSLEIWKYTSIHFTQYHFPYAKSVLLFDADTSCLPNTNILFLTSAQHSASNSGEIYCVTQHYHEGIKGRFPISKPTERPLLFAREDFLWRSTKSLRTRYLKQSTDSSGFEH